MCLKVLRGRRRACGRARVALQFKIFALLMAKHSRRRARRLAFGHSPAAALKTHSLDVTNELSQGAFRLSGTTSTI